MFSNNDKPKNVRNKKMKNMRTKENGVEIAYPNGLFVFIIVYPAMKYIIHNIITWHDALRLYHIDVNKSV